MISIGLFVVELLAYKVSADSLGNSVFIWEGGPLSPGVTDS